MTRAVGAIFDAGYAILQTKKALCKNNNLLLDMVNWRPWIELELKYLLNPYSLRGLVCEDEEASVQMGDMGFPTEMLERARSVMRNELLEMIRQGIGPVREFHEYDVEFLDSDPSGAVYNLKIVDMGDRRALELERQRKEDEMFAESGGYVPERQRTSYNY